MLNIISMSVEEIENAIVKLSKHELAELATWFADHQAKVWDDRIARDLESGRLNSLLEEVDSEINKGEAKPL